MNNAGTIAPNPTLFKETSVIRTPSHADALVLVRALESFYKRTTGKALSSCGPDSVPDEVIAVIIRKTGEFSYFLDGDEEMVAHFSQKDTSTVAELESTVAVLNGDSEISGTTMSRLILNITQRERVTNAREILREIITLPEAAFDTETLDTLDSLRSMIKNNGHL